MNKKIISFVEILTHMVGLIRTTFWRFLSYELARHPCIVISAVISFFSLWNLYDLITNQFQYNVETGENNQIYINKDKVDFNAMHVYVCS